MLRNLENFDIYIYKVTYKLYNIILFSNNSQGFF